jgi:hypothetical protein
MVVSKGLMDFLTLEIVDGGASKSAVIPRESGGIECVGTSEICREASGILGRRATTMVLLTPPA